MNWRFRFEKSHHLKRWFFPGVVILVLWWLFFPRGYQHGFELDFQEPARNRFAICNYREHPFYAPNVYDCSKSGENQLFTLKNETTDQNIIFFKSREHPDVEFRKIAIKSESVKGNWAWAITGVDTSRKGLHDTEQSSTNFIYQWFLLVNTNPSLSDNSLTIKGLREIKHKEIFETPSIEVFYLRASFQDRIGFYKKNVSWWRFYPVSVFDFKGNADGAIAIVKSKPSGKTIIVIGSVPSHKNFNEPEFRSVVESIQF